MKGRNCSPSHLRQVTCTHSGYAMNSVTSFTDFCCCWKHNEHAVAAWTHPSPTNWHHLHHFNLGRNTFTWPHSFTLSETNKVHLQSAFSIPAIVNVHEHTLNNPHRENVGICWHQLKKNGTYWVICISSNWHTKPTSTFPLYSTGRLDSAANHFISYCMFIATYNSSSFMYWGNPRYGQIFSTGGAHLQYRGK